MIRSTRTVVAGLFLLVFAPPGLAAPELPAKKLDALAEAGRKAWGAPGLAIVVVHDDQAHAAGHGAREAGKADPVTADTLFSIGSLTKAFAATSLAILIDDGKAGWDDKVRDHLPYFRLADPLADREVRLRDLLCHRTGLARHDQLWYRAPWSLEESVKRLAHLPRSSSFRSKYEYNNLCYTAAGFAVARTAGMGWDEWVRKRLLTPLGMKHTVFTASAAKKAKDHATPHHRDASGKQLPIDWYPDDKQVRAAGSIKSCANDLAAWLKLQLHQGAFGGKQIVSAKALAETHRGQVVVPVSGEIARRAGVTQQSYGLGWMVSTYRGHRALSHGGANDGFRARILLLPKEKLGLVVLTNTDQTGVVEATSNSLLDALLGLKPIDWHDLYRKADTRARADAAAKAKRLLASRKTGTKPTRELSAYAGAFHHKAYGEATIEAGEKSLRLKWSSFTVPMEHFHYDTFRLRGGRFENELATFTIDADGKVRTLKVLGQTFARKAHP